VRDREPVPVFRGLVLCVGEMTRAELLRHALSQALRKVHVEDMKLKRGTVSGY